MSPAPHIRPLNVADSTAAAALIRHAFARQSQITDPPAAALRETAANISAHLVRGGGGAVAVSDKILIGAVLWEEQDGGLYFGRLAVHSSARGQGVGRTLLAAVEAEARRRGLDRAHLSVRIPLLDNRRFFAAAGYVETCARAHPGYSVPTTMAMEKKFPPDGT